MKKANNTIVKEEQNTNNGLPLIKENKSPVISNNALKPIVDNDQKDIKKEVPDKQLNEENQKSIESKEISTIKENFMVEDSSCSRSEMSTTLDSNQKSSHITSNSYSSQSILRVGEVGSPENKMIYSNSMSSLPSATVVTVNKPSRYIFKKNHNHIKSKENNLYKQKRSVFPSNKVYNHHPYHIYYKSSNTQEGISNISIPNSYPQTLINSNSYGQYYPSCNLYYRRVKKLGGSNPNSGYNKYYVKYRKNNSHVNNTNSSSSSSNSSSTYINNGNNRVSLNNNLLAPSNSTSTMLINSPISSFQATPKSYTSNDVTTVNNYMQLNNGIQYIKY